MCNLSEGIEERAAKRIMLSMYEKGYTLDQIADVTGISATEVSAIVEKKEPIWV